MAKYILQIKYGTKATIKIYDKKEEVMAKVKETFNYYTQNGVSAIFTKDSEKWPKEKYRAYITVMEDDVVLMPESSVEISNIINGDKCTIK